MTRPVHGGLEDTRAAVLRTSTLCWLSDDKARAAAAAATVGVVPKSTNTYLRFCMQNCVLLVGMVFPS
jgi:hypothetical protein